MKSGTRVIRSGFLAHICRSLSLHGPLRSPVPQAHVFYVVCATTYGPGRGPATSWAHDTQCPRPSRLLGAGIAGNLGGGRAVAPCTCCMLYVFPYPSCTAIQFLWFLSVQHGVQNYSKFFIGHSKYNSGHLYPSALERICNKMPFGVSPLLEMGPFICEAGEDPWKTYSTIILSWGRIIRGRALESSEKWGHFWR